jgi:hypothetical protein
MAIVSLVAIARNLITMGARTVVSDAEELQLSQ